MTWCEENGVGYVFGLAGNAALHHLICDADLKMRCAEAGADGMRGFADFAYAARLWCRRRRFVARLEEAAGGFDARTIVTSLAGKARHLYEAVYCTRGQAENLIKQHKVQLASDWTSCRSPLANRVRLVLHAAAYWLMLALRNTVPCGMSLVQAEFVTLRQCLLRIGCPRFREDRPHPHPLRLRLPGRQRDASPPRVPDRRSAVLRQTQFLQLQTPALTISYPGAPKRRMEACARSKSTDKHHLP